MPDRQWFPIGKSFSEALRTRRRVGFVLNNKYLLEHYFRKTKSNSGVRARTRDLAVGY